MSNITEVKGADIQLAFESDSIQDEKDRREFVKMRFRAGLIDMINSMHNAGTEVIADCVIESKCLADYIKGAT